MMKPKSRFVAMLALRSIADVASAQSDQPWNGFYAGLNAGGAWNTSCRSGTLAAALVDPALATVHFNRACPNRGCRGGMQV
jgi:hypothetical protein